MLSYLEVSRAAFHYPIGMAASALEFGRLGPHLHKVLEWYLPCLDERSSTSQPVPTRETEHNNSQYLY